MHHFRQLFHLRLNLKTQIEKQPCLHRPKILISLSFKGGKAGMMPAMQLSENA